MVKKTGGIWAGKKGLSAGRDANRSAHDKNLARIRARLEYLYRLMGELEETIDLAGSVLAISQPSSGNGRLTLRWWKLHSQDELRDPVIVKWVLNKGGGSTPQLVEKTRIRRDGTFAINAKEAEECIQLLRELIQLRKHFKRKANQVERTLSMLEATELRINDRREIIRTLKKRVVDNLLQAGYEVESRILES